MRQRNRGTSAPEKAGGEHSAGPALLYLGAINIAKLPSVPRQILKDIPRPPNSASRDD